MTVKLQWKWVHYDGLTKDDVYDILALRERVFIAEQKCPFVEADYRDQKSYHLLGRSESSPATLCCYLRVVAPGVRFKEHSIGRVICDTLYRGQGLGKLLMEKGHDQIQKTWGEVPIRIHAQDYLRSFYEDLGYEVVSEIFMEEGRPHVEMLRGR